jgi:hypothetical protein
MFRALFFLFALLSASTASAQVLVYKLDFSKDRGINYHTFEGGYFVAPLLGGAGTFLLTSNEEGLIYTESTDGGRLFTAVSNDDKKAVISATTGTGTAAGAFVALGDIDHTVKVNNAVYSLTAKVAKTLTGTAVTADDESEVEAPATDGSLGSAGIAKLKIVLDEEETNRANRDGLSLTQAVEQVKLTLERQGYSDGVEEEPETPATTTATETTTTTEE